MAFTFDRVGSSRLLLWFDLAITGNDKPRTIMQRRAEPISACMQFRRLTSTRTPLSGPPSGANGPAAGASPPSCA